MTVTKRATMRRQAPLLALCIIAVPLPAAAQEILAHRKDQAHRRRVDLRKPFDNLDTSNGFDLRGAGAYDIIAGRVASAYLTVDF